MRWKLSGYLERHGLNANQVAVTAGLSPNTVYPMVRGVARRVDLRSLERVMTALVGLTGEEVRLDDLLEFEQVAAEPAAWQRLAGIYDVPGLPVDAAINHDKYLDEMIAEEHTAIVQASGARLDPA